jgi:hypothetical protein
MELKELTQVIIGLSERSHGDRIKIFGWFLHTQQNLPHFEPSDIGKCYDMLHMARPSSFSGYFENLVTRGDLLKTASGYRLDDRVREALDAQHGTREITIQVTQLLLNLPNQLPDLAERTYLSEALICYKQEPSARRS